MKYQLLIERSRNEGTWQEPMTIDDISWETYRKESPSKLTFTVIKDETLGFNEGAAVKFIAGEKSVFYGYVFEKSRDKDQQIKVVAYDQLRYFKNKNAYIFDKLRLDEFLRRICKDFLLKTGEIANTGYKIPQIFYNNHTLFDMIQGCIDETLQATGKLFCLYDKSGALCLKNIKDMQLNKIIDRGTAENFDYTSSIDGETYNRIKIQHSTEDKGLGNYVVEEHTKSIKDWGVLQKFEAVNEWNNEAQAREKAKKLLELYNSKRRNLTIKGCIGDLDCRAGTSPIINLELGDLNLNNHMLIEEATHHFENGRHSMDLKLSGHGDFYG